MDASAGYELAVFVGVTLCVMGFAAYMTGQATGGSWKPVWHPIAYAFLFGFANRFLVYALFDGELLSPGAYLRDTVVLVAITLVAFRIALARKMVEQYPWLYERAGPFSWRSKPGTQAPGS